jgi:hypothetical protein
MNEYNPDYCHAKEFYPPFTYTVQMFIFQPISHLAAQVGFTKLGRQADATEQIRVHTHLTYLSYHTWI